MADFDREHDMGTRRAGPVRRRGAQEPAARAPATHTPCDPRRFGKHRPRRFGNRRPRLRAAHGRFTAAHGRFTAAHGHFTAAHGRFTAAHGRFTAVHGLGLRTAPGAARSRSRLAPLLHALFLVASATQTAIVPLLPRLSHAYSLSPSAGALLLAAPGLATLAVSMPAGVFADRLGARRVTVAAAFLMCAAAVAQAAPSYPMLIGGRLAFGLAFGIVWTTGVAWMSSSHSEAGSPQLGAVATSAAVGMVAGPAIGGIVADQFGLSSPFLAVGGLAAVLGTLLWRQPADARPTRLETARESLREFVRAAPRELGVLTGAGVLAIAGAVGGVTQLLVPLQLHQAGFSASGTGVAFSAAAGLYIVVSAFVVKLGRRATTSRLTALAGLALALSLLPAVVGVGALGLVGVLLLSTAPRALVSTVSYPLATESAAGADLPDGAVIGLLNGTWATGLVLAPLIAGAVDQVGGPAVAYLTAVVPGSIGALWLVARANAARTATEHAPAAADVEHASKPPTAEHELVVVHG